jgi:hypothetical protein
MSGTKMTPVHWHQPIWSHRAICGWPVWGAIDRNEHDTSIANRRLSWLPNKVADGIELTSFEYSGDLSSLTLVNLPLCDPRDLYEQSHGPTDNIAADTDIANDYVCPCIFSTLPK